MQTGSCQSQPCKLPCHTLETDTQPMFRLGPYGSNLLIHLGLCVAFTLQALGPRRHTTFVWLGGSQRGSMSRFSSKNRAALCTQAH